MVRYAAAAIGAAVGLYGGAVAGGLLGNAYAALFMPNAELEGLAPVVIGVLAGGLLGAILICWATLRLVGDPLAGRSGLLVAPILIGFGVVAQVLTADTVLSPDRPLPALLALASGLVARLVAGVAFPTTGEVS